MRLKSLIVHDDVSFIEIRRGEGIEGGDTLVVGVEHGESAGQHEEASAYYFLPPSLMRLNRYRFRYPIVEVEVKVDKDIVEKLNTSPEKLNEVIKREGRLTIPPIEGRRPRLVAEAVYVEKGVKLTIRLCSAEG